MRYRVKGVEVRSENAAKPHTQRSKVVAAYLKACPTVGSLMDYGCGKLRYSDLLTRIARRVSFVDSDVQLTRRQRIRGRMTTVVQCVSSRYQNARVLTIAQAHRGRARFDRVTCINVLSAIPTLSELHAALGIIRQRTKRTGVAVFVNQHRNSYFKKFTWGKPHLFGHLYTGRRGHSYYGVFTMARVRRLLRGRGFRILNAWQSGEINFVEARPCF